MWCIPKVTPEFIERMEDVLALYEKPYNPREPVICFDEKSKQLLRHIRLMVPPEPGRLRRYDYEYKRNGTRNIFIAVEPKGGYREATVTNRRTKQDFAYEMKRIAKLPRYGIAKKIHIVLDNLNVHFEKSLSETFGEKQAQTIMSRIQFHYTPKHASWLNMAEIEIGILNRQCIRGRIPTEETLRKKIGAWQAERNRKGATINWKFNAGDARNVFHYESAKLS